MTAQRTELTIGEVSDLTGISAHTLRFYEKERLFVEPVRRNASGHRVFSEDEVGWLRVCSRLRSSGMPLPQIRRYADLVRAGESTVQERHQLLVDHQAAVESQVAELTEALDVIKTKVAIYATHLADGTADSLWRTGPSC